MKIADNTIAQVAYKIHINSFDGELVEFADESAPRLMIFGYEKVIPGFESNMSGLDAGESFRFSLQPESAFGEYKQEMIVKVPKSAFVVHGEMRNDLLYIGNEISMMDNHGNPVRGKVVELSKDEVHMDFNHPLAGKSLHIEGKVMSVRPVTDEDLAPKGGGCCGGGCGCGSAEEASHDHHHHGEEDCQVCGNPPELQGQGIGSCRCG